MTYDAAANRITDITIRVCRGASETADVTRTAELRGGQRPPFLVLTVTAADGTTGTSFGFSTLNPRAAGEAMVPIKQFFHGRDVYERERAALEFRRFDRQWTLSPSYSYGPFDNALWDIIGKKSGTSVSRLLGRFRDRVPVYVSSMFHDGGVEDYLQEVLAVQAAGYHGYKVHPSGILAEDLELYAAVRETVGPTFALMADPVGAYSYSEAMIVGRELERHGYLWLEEPVHDVDWSSQQALQEALDIPIVGTETSPWGLRGTSAAIAHRQVDAVRTDVSWRGGITEVMKVGVLADAFGMRCELHSCIYHALELINLQCASAMTNCSYFELLYPLQDYDFGLRSGIQINDGYATVPDVPGLGIDYDWDFIDDQTVVVL